MTDPAAARSPTVAWDERGVGSGLTSITWPPERSVAKGSDAAGCTSEEVPTTSASSASPANCNDCSKTRGSSASPNHTTSGRRRPRQEVQRGSVSGREASIDPPVGSTLLTGGAPDPEQGSVKLQRPLVGRNFAGAAVQLECGAFVQAVHVLGDQARPIPLAHESRDRPVGRVGEAGSHADPAPLVPFPHQARVPGESLGGCKFLRSMMLPEAIGPAEGGHSGLCADSGTSQHQNPIHPRDQLARSFELGGRGRCLTHPRKILHPRSAQPTIRAIPPRGVTAPSQRCPERTSR